MFSFLRPIIKALSISRIPEYKTEGAAAFDISIISDRVLSPGELFNFGTNLKLEIPKGWCLLVLPRSSLGQKKCIIPNSVGLIDSDYRGEIMIPILNLSDSTVTFQAGQRVAQGLLIKASQCDIIRTQSLSSTKRGSGGFGSTGL